MAYSFLLLSPLACLIVALVLVSLYTLQLVTETRRRRLPPGPTPLPLLGNLLSIKRDSPHRSLASLAECHGPLISVWLGVVRTVVASSPAAARDILHKKNASLAYRPKIDSWCGNVYYKNSLFILPLGDKWRAMRKLCKEDLLAPRRLDALQPLRQLKVHGMLRLVAEHAARDEPVEIGTIVSAVTMSVMSHTLMSTDLDLDMTNIVKEATVLLGTPNISDFFPALATFDLMGLRSRMGEIVSKAYGIIEEQIVRRKGSREDGEPCRGDLLDLVLDKEQEWQQDSSSVLNRDAVKGLLTDLFAAGTDSTSTTVVWAMAELLQNPVSMAKVKEELTRVLGTKALLEDSDTIHLPYLQAVVKETFRLHPAAPFTFYKAEADTEVQGYNVPKGSTIILNIWAVHRHPNEWVDPDKFMPERFIGKDTNFLGHHTELIPFAGGRRICPGLPLAHRMVHLVLASLLHRFYWKVPGHGEIDMTEKFGLVLSMANPLKAIATE